MKLNAQFFQGILPRCFVRPSYQVWNSSQQQHRWRVFQELDDELVGGMSVLAAPCLPTCP